MITLNPGNSITGLDFMKLIEGNSLSKIDLSWKWFNVDVITL